MTQATSTTKKAELARLLRRKNGASLVQLQMATGWQPHSIRAAISGLRKDGLIVERAPGKTPGAGALYRVVRPGQAAR